MLAHGDHPRRAHRAVVDEADQLGRRRHVAVLQPDPRHGAGRPAASSSMRRWQSSTVVHSGFSTSACRSVASTSPTTSTWVWFGVATTTASHRPLASRSAWSANARTSAPAAAGRPLASRLGVGDGGHDGAGDGADVLDVLDAHHPRADHPVAHARPRRHPPPANHERIGTVPGRGASPIGSTYGTHAVVDGVDVSALRLFLAVVELGSVSKAAVRHGLTQPSATAKLQKLERQLGVQLLDRGPSGSVATAAGVHLASACAEVVAATVALVDRAGARRGTSRRASP